MEKLHLGSASELRRRVNVLENTEVLKSIDARSIDSFNSDVVVVAEKDTAPVPASDSYAIVDKDIPIKTTSYTGASTVQDTNDAVGRVTKVVFCSNEPSCTDVLWAKPVEGGGYQFYIYLNGMWTSVAGGGSGGIIINVGDISGDISAFNNDAGYVTQVEMQETASGKQDKIEDLTEIRQNASAGASAYRKPSGGISENDLSSSIQNSLAKADTALQQKDLNGKQDTIADLEEIRSNAALGADASQSLVSIQDNIASLTSGQEALEDNVGQLSERIDGMQGSKFYGHFETAGSLPSVGNYDGYAYVGSSAPFEIYDCLSSNGVLTWTDSGTTTQETVVPSGGGEEGLLELSTSDGTANRATLNAALALGDVKLKKGHYPVDPGITVNNVILDLNGACLQSTKEKHTSPMIMVKGERPIIRNGEICGNYNTADNEPGYEFFENENLIGCKLYGDALLENLDIHNCWGTAIVYGGVNWETEGVRKSIHNATPITTTQEGRSTETIEYLSESVVVPSGYSYTCIYGGIGYNRILSEKNAVYTFYDSGGNQIKQSSAMPNIPVLVPTNAATLTVRTFTFDNFKDTRIGFMNSRCDCLTVKDCRIHNNHSLGMVGMQFGTTKVINCRSYEHGKPRTTASATDRDTTGFIDIEDVASPIFIMEGCTSKSELKLAMLGAYRTSITNCQGSIGIYRGWSANISNCVGKVWTISNTLTTLVNVSNCVFYSNDSTSINWTGSNNTFVGCKPDDLTREHDFIIRRLNTTSTAMSLNGVIRGKITNPCGHANKGITNVATARGSNLVFDWALSGNADSASYGTYNVDGDCHGIISTIPFLPNGHTIYDSTFNLHHSYGQTGSINNPWVGEYNNCTFNLRIQVGTNSSKQPIYEEGSMFYSGASFSVKDSGGVLTFRNCTINNDGNKYLFNGFPNNISSRNYTIRFINCTISNPNKLFATSTSGITIQHITEDTDYDARIKALVARIEALEGS